MKVPDCDNAYIPVAKIKEYLLSKTHPIGKTKAHFFNQVGYTLQNRNLLINDIHTIIKENSAARIIETEFGTKYIVKGAVGERFGKRQFIVTVWIIEESKTFPRFITAYPAR
jgi:hypothetical protein